MTLWGELGLMESLTRRSPDLRKKDDPPAPGPAVAVVLIPPARRDSSMAADPTLTRAAFSSAVISLIFFPFTDIAEPPTLTWFPYLQEDILFQGFTIVNMIVAC